VIGHFLLSLTPREEGRVLTRQMLPFVPGKWEESCLMQTIIGGGIRATEATQYGPVALKGYRVAPFPARQRRAMPKHWQGPTPQWAGYRAYHTVGIAGQYDHLCFRFGHERINAAIRNRVLRNQARRALAGVREVASV
jgi:hypothetical protein